MRPASPVLPVDNRRPAREDAQLRSELEPLGALVEELRRAGKRQADP